MELKQSTIAVVKIGPFTATTGTVLTALTIAQADVRLSKNGGNMAQKGTGTACVHDELGVYFCDLSATDTGTLGALRLDVDKSGSAALMVWHFYEIVTSQYYDAKYGTGRFEVDVQELDGASAAAAEFLNMYDGTGYAGGTIRFGADVQEIDGASACAVNLQNMYDGTGYAGGAIRFGADVQELDGASAGIANLQNMYDGTGYAGGSIKFITTGGTCDTIAANAINAVAFADNAIGGSAIANGAIDAATFASGALAAGAASGATIAANALGASATTIAANALGASATTIAASALGASAATIAAAIWSAVAGSYDVNNTFGNVFNDLTEDNGGVFRFTSAALGQGPTGAGASATTIAANALGASATTIAANALGASATTIAANALGASATTIAKAVWNAVAASYDVNNTFGNFLNDLTEDNGGTYRFTSAALGQGPVGAGASAITIAANALGASATTIAANALGASATTIAAAVWNATAASYDTNNAFGNIINDLTEDSGGTYRFTAAASIQGACSSATINAQVLDVLNTDTFAEPGQGAPGATTTLVTKIGYLYKFSRNKITSTSALIAIYNDDGTTVGQKSVIADDSTTFTRGEIGTGA